MSLINDALKRAKEAHQQAPVPPRELPFRPVEPAQRRVRHGLGIFLPVLLAVVALLALFLAWQWTRRSPAANSTEAAARTPAAAPMADGTSGWSAMPPEPAAPVPAAAILAAPGSDTNVAAASPAPAAPDNPPVANSQDVSTTNAAPVAAPEPPKPAPLRLQAILFHPQRPSAIISGKTVFVGDRVRDLRVLAIDQDSTTLASLSETNVLTLSH